uniref:Uncharacterized protein n=1 Tax=Rhizophora mucronata TaxID=61149 RepID=A0A2P2NBF2_RHIMU
MHNILIILEMNLLTKAPAAWISMHDQILDSTITKSSGKLNFKNPYGSFKDFKLHKQI